MGKSITSDLLRDNNFRYFLLIWRRILIIGPLKVGKELLAYYNKFSRFPKLIGIQSPDTKYKLFVLYNYFKIVAVHPGIDFKDLMNYFPTRLQKYFIFKLDPKEKREITFNKILFYQKLDEAELPYPRVIFYVKQSRKFKITGEEFFPAKDIIPKLCFVKPVCDNGGDRAGVFTAEVALTTEEGFMAQELAKNHIEIVKLAGNFAFNTVRIISYISNDGKVNLLSAILRLSKGKQVDNWGKGSINVMVNIADGSLGKIGITKRNEKYEKHPAGIIKFENFMIPYWQDLVNIVIRGSDSFSYLRLIAWDIGISQNGPLIVEANAGCDFFHAQLFKPYGESILIKDLIDA